MENKQTVTVGTLLSLYANSLQSTLDGKLTVVEGFYSPNNGRLYGNYYYDEILDRDKMQKMTIQISPDHKNKLEAGSYYTFQGFIVKCQNLDNEARIKVLFRVSQIPKLDDKVQLISQSEYNIIRERFNRDFPIVRDILLEKIENQVKPRIDFLTGIQSTSNEDCLNPIKNPEYYEIRTHTCNFSSKKEIMDFFTSHNFNGTDLLVIMRGGGSGLEIFDDIDLCKASLELPVPLITGIGHYEDKTLLQRIADRGFPTPTSVGVFLQQVVDIQKKRVESVKIAEEERFGLSQQVRLQKKQINRLLVVLFTLLLIVVITIIMYVQ
ncbi:exodeoxyribonuclease VII large subunit [Tamlana flava]|uniref:exodeoxyribonuclease VII large subunit n=1 Tax=Tamlana flava TaxID=3158572 RepID=UPI00351AEF93